MRVVVVGAGLSGLLAARRLSDRGLSVTVLDKGSGPGGRLATRRIGPAVVDHGAQFFTVRTDEFAALVARWEADGLVREWSRGFGATPDGHPRYAVAGGMNALAKHLAADLDVRTRTFVFAVRPSRRGWSVGLDDGEAVPADALVVTCPLPQAGAVLITAEVPLPEELRTTDYDRTLALLAVLDRPSAIPAPGGHQPERGVFSFVADNLRKGISPVPAVTLHANSAWSAEHWDDDRTELHRALLHEARPWLGDAIVVESQVKRWRFATPQAISPEPTLLVAGGVAPLALAGDAFAGPRVEGAALSGLAAADALAS